MKKQNNREINNTMKVRGKEKQKYIKVFFFERKDIKVLKITTKWSLIYIPFIPMETV